MTKNDIASITAAIAAAAVLLLSLAGRLGLVPAETATDIRAGVEEGICPPCPADTDLP